MSLHAQLLLPQTICETRLDLPGPDPYVVLEDDALEWRERDGSDRDWFVAPGFVPPVLRYD